MRAFLILFTFVFIGTQADAQWRADTRTSLFSALFSSSPAQPGGENVFSPDMSSILVSGFVGFNHNTNLGSFTYPITDCQCTFDGKFGLVKFGLVFGGDITYVFSREWGVIAKLYYDDKHTTEKFERSTISPIRYGSQVITTAVQYEEDASVKLSYLTLGLFMRYQPRLQRWYLFAGPGVGMKLSGNVEQTEKIVTEELTFIEGGNRERIVSQLDIADQEAIRAEGLVGAGYEYMLSPRLFFSPEIMVGYPITKITKVDSDWKVMSVRISAGIKYVAF